MLHPYYLKTQEAEEDQKFKASLHRSTRFCLKIKYKTKKEKEKKKAMLKVNLFS